MPEVSHHDTPAALVSTEAQPKESTETTHTEKEAAPREVTPREAIATETSTTETSTTEASATIETEDKAAQNKFAALNLPDILQRAVDDLGYEQPSPIQAQIIPAMLVGRDVLGVAQTGTGKTAAFALPALTRVDTRQKGAPQVLCLAPTRELAIQVAEAFQSYAKYIKHFNVLPIYGGTDYRSQLRQLKRGVQVVVGTPGRVMDHIRRGSLVLDNINTVVLDEADEMLSMGFIEDIEWVLEQIEHNYQMALFSATMPRQIRNIISKYLKEPVEVTIKHKTTTSPMIRQRFVRVNNRDKLELLTRILEVEVFDGMVIFVRTKNATEEVAQKLQARGYDADALNGDIAQKQREKTVDKLKNGQIDIIVATDVAARGLDVPRVSHVINLDVPYDTESYVHRIGRTGRAGREGDAILFITGREQRLLKSIERSTRKQIERYEFPSVDSLNDRKLEHFFTRVDSIMQEELKEYVSIIKKYLQHNPEVEPLMVAAALARLEAGREEFYVKDLPKLPEARVERGGREGRREGGQRGETRRGRQASKGRRYSNLPTETYRLEVGETHGVRKGDIVGAIANEAGIASKDMGKIRLFEEHSFIDLPEGMPSQVHDVLQKVRVRGRPLKMTKAGAKVKARRSRRGRE